MSMKINCTVLTPDRVLYEGNVEFAVVQAFDGEMGFLYNHSPLVSELGYGEIRLHSGNDVNRLVVEGGLVEIRNNEMIILAENAIKRNDLSAPEIEKRLNELVTQEKPADKTAKLMMDLEVKKLKARLRVASK